MEKRRLGRIIQFSIPVTITIILYVFTIYQFMIPMLHDAILEKRMELAKQMTLSAQSILMNYEKQANEGELTAKEAQDKAVEVISAIRYGDDMKDYFWITDDQPNMIHHPYRQDLNGTYVGEFEDPKGNRLFKEMADLVKAQGAGFTQYEWQKNDAPESTTSKISYVILFEPWNWTVGTGVYLEDIEEEAKALSQKFTLIATAMLIGIILIMSVISFRAGRLENEKITATEEQTKINELFQGIFDNTYQLTGFLESDGTLLKANKKALDLIGKSDKEVLGRKFWDTPWWNHSTKEMDRIMKAVQQAGKGEISRCETYHYNKDEERVDIDMVFSPIRDQNGRIRYILPEGRDITQQKAEEKLLKQQNANLENQVREHSRKLHDFLEDLEGTQQQLMQSEKMAALGRLVAGVAHEINTPLGISVTASSYLNEQTRAIKDLTQEENLTQEEFNSYLETAIESSAMILSNLERAAGQIKVFKQVAVDQADEAIRSFMLKEYLLEIVKSLHPELKKKPCLIEISCPEELEITTYPGVISQIISNLTMNSIKHGFKNRDSGTITIECHRKESHLIMDYQDNGRGIPEGTANKLFEPFYTTARNEGGTGLGLHIVYNLVIQKLKGSITINTRLESGLGFLIDFPVEQE